MEDSKTEPTKNEPEKKLSQEEKNKHFLEQIQKLRESQELINLGKSGAIKTEYKFWGTQPVQQFYRDPPTKFGPIITDNKIENEQKEPYSLPEGYEWGDIDLSKSNELDKLFEFLKTNYVHDDSSLFGTEYSKEFLKWYFSFPNSKKWLISVLKEDKKKNKKKIVGFISAITTKISVNGTEIQTVKTNFLCVKKELRSHNLATVLMQELIRRVHLENIWQGIFATFTLVPTPFCKTLYCYRNINVQKLIDVRYTFLPKGVNMNKAIKNYELPEKPEIEGFRKMEEKDIDQVFELFEKNKSKYKVFEIYNKEEIAHLLLAKNNVIYSFVLESENKKITDFFSFCCLLRPILKNDKYKKLNCDYGFVYINTTISIMELIKTAIIFAKNYNFDVYHYVGYVEYGNAFKELKFNEKLGKLKYYLYNFVCSVTAIEDVSLLFV